VLTYEVDGWPCGVLTGYDDECGGLTLEHVIAWKPYALRPMLYEGLAYAWERGASYVTFYIKQGHPHAEQLTRLGERFGALQYERCGNFAYYVVHR
jgi:hypothetical protein